MHGRVVKKRALLEPLVDENVVRNAQQLFNIQLLINAGDARSSGLVRVLEVLLYAIYENLALIRLMYAGEYLDQRRFAGAVLTDQAEDLARLDCQLHVSQSHYARKTLGRVFQFYYVFTHLHITFSSPR